MSRDKGLIEDVFNYFGGKFSWMIKGPEPCHPWVVLVGVTQF